MELPSFFAREEKLIGNYVIRREGRFTVHRNRLKSQFDVIQPAVIKPIRKHSEDKSEFHASAQTQNTPTVSAAVD